MEKPKIYDNDVEFFLNDIRNEGKHNMYGVVPFLIMQFAFSRQQAKECLAYYMQRDKNEK